MPVNRYAVQNHVTEWGYQSSHVYEDPFNQIEMDVVFCDEASNEWRVPAYWAGDNEWRVRFCPPHPGVYHYRTVCTNEADSGLHGVTGVLWVAEYQGEHPLYKHGRLRVSGDRRRFVHEDGTPFFWLGDTCWFLLSSRLQWPDEYQLYIQDRQTKGFTVMQLVAGLYPDGDSFDVRGVNEAGFPWEQGYRTINPAYFDAADVRIQWLVKSGMVPCIFGCWGFLLLKMGMEKMKRHWRYLVARYGAYPVTWSLAGEATMPYYLSETPDTDSQALKTGWTEVGRYVRSIDPFHNPITIHAPHYSGSRAQVVDESVLDYDMPQPGHGTNEHAPHTAKLISELINTEPHMPVVNGEVLYEANFDSAYGGIQRYAFWTTMLMGGAGHTYGANGLFQLNRPGDPFGPSPHGMQWGDIPWTVAYRFQGSTDVGIGKSILERYRWWDFVPHPEWIEPHAGERGYNLPYAAGIQGEVRMFYLPGPIRPWCSRPVLKRLDRSRKYRVFWVDTTTGVDTPIDDVRIDADGDWQMPLPPVMRDWILVIEEDDRHGST